MRYRLTIALIMICLLAQAQQDTIHVYFDSKSTELNTAAYQTIDSNIYYDILLKGKKTAVIYYSDNHRSNKRNNEQAKERADAVAQYLMSMGLTAEDIQLAESTAEQPYSLKSIKDYNPFAVVNIIPGGITLSLDTKPSAPTVVDKSIPELNNANTNDIIRLEHIEFEPGSDKLLPESTPTLTALHNSLTNNPALRIQIEGHVCCADMYHLPEHPTKRDIAFKKIVEEEAMSLSLKRANKVYDYLLKKGIDKDRLKTKGFGATAPIYESDGKTINKQKNRRVEIRVMEK